MRRLLIGVLLVGCNAFVTGIQIRPGIQSFSSAIKGGKISANTEKVLYEYIYDSQDPRRPDTCGLITEQWFTGKQTITVIVRLCAFYRFRWWSNGREYENTNLH